MDKRNIILEKSFELALKCIAYSELLENDKKYVIARQILKSGTSIGANINEAQSSESKVDFIHKLKIADKEANELKYWFELCKSSPSYSSPPESLQNELIEIMKLLSKIISTAKSNI